MSSPCVPSAYSAACYLRSRISQVQNLSFHLVKTPGKTKKTKNKNSSDRFPLRPTGENKTYLSKWKESEATAPPPPHRLPLIPPLPPQLRWRIRPLRSAPPPREVQVVWSFSARGVLLNSLGPTSLQSPTRSIVWSLKKNRNRNNTWLRVKNGYPQFNPGKWKYELQSRCPLSHSLSHMCHSHMCHSHMCHQRNVLFPSPVFQAGFAYLQGVLLALALGVGCAPEERQTA